MKIKRKYDYLKEKCQGKTVCHLGYVGEGWGDRLHRELMPICNKLYGIDIESSNHKNTFICDVMDEYFLFLCRSEMKDVELFIAPDILEHLPNAGLFLSQLRKTNTPAIFIVPNAFRLQGIAQTLHWTETTNPTHVAFHSMRTMQRLMLSYNFNIDKSGWVAQRSKRLLYMIWPQFCPSLYMEVS